MWMPGEHRIVSDHRLHDPEHLRRRRKADPREDHLARRRGPPRPRVRLRRRWKSDRRDHRLRRRRLTLVHDYDDDGHRIETRYDFDNDGVVDVNGENDTDGDGAVDEKTVSNWRYYPARDLEKTADICKSWKATPGASYRASPG